MGKILEALGVQRKDKTSEELSEEVDYTAAVQSAYRISKEMEAMANVLMDKASELREELENHATPGPRPA